MDNIKTSANIGLAKAGQTCLIELWNIIGDLYLFWAFVLRFPRLRKRCPLCDIKKTKGMNPSKLFYLLLLIVATNMNAQTNKIIQIEQIENIQLEPDEIWFTFFLYEGEKYFDDLESRKKDINAVKEAEDELLKLFKKANIEYIKAGKNLYRGKFVSFENLNDFILSIGFKAYYNITGSVYEAKILNREKAEQELIQKCYNEAIKKSEFIAKSAKLELGNILEITHSIPDYSYAAYMAELGRRDLGLKVVQPAEETLSCKLIIKFEVK